MKNLFFILFASFLLFSCQEEIVLDLQEADPKLVIEANISPYPMPSYVVLSETENLYDFDGINVVHDADVYLKNYNGDIDTLTLDENGIYRVNPDFYIGEGWEYYLTVVRDKVEYTSYAIVPSRVSIDSVASERADFGPPNNKAMSVYVYFQDPGEQEDFYNFVFYINGERYIHPFAGNLVGNDEEFNGETFTFPINLIDIKNGSDVILDIEPGDSVYVELRHITKDMFDYYNTLNNIVSSGGPMGSSTPYNPISNIEGDALGYFGAYTSSFSFLVLEE